MRPLTSRIARFARERTVLVVSALAALATVAFVPPDEAYLGYFDVKTLACLFGILAVVGALRGIGLFEHAARLIVARFFTCRSAVAALVGSTLVLSMFSTNDLALIMMLPLSAATLLKAGWERSLPFAFIMQNLAANLGGMILPFGNPQNLYLYERFSIPLGDFLSSMALPFAVSVVLIALCCVLFAKPEPPKATKKRASEKEAAEKGKPVLGICLGLQLMFDYSEESAGVEGLHLLKGAILRIPDKEGLKIPHIGWNSLTLENDGRLFAGLSGNPYVYFVHSYYLKAEDEQIVKASTEYSTHIHASVEQGNIFACQFHPEKSSSVGLHILSNFAKIQGGND